MAESSCEGAENVSSEAKDDRELDPKKNSLMKPDKKKHEEELAMIAEKIQEITTKQKSHPSGAEDRAELKSIQPRVRDMIDKRRGVDQALQQVNTNIAKKNAEITRVESTLRYKTEEATNKTIKRLEDQLKMQNFRLSDERKIVAEIDALKRSKRALGQYLTLKNEVLALRDSAKRLRQDLDKYHNEVRALRQREHQLKTKIQNDKLSAQKMKSELDELFDRKRTCVNMYQQQFKDYQQTLYKFRKQRQHEFYRKKYEFQQQEKEADKKEMAEFESTFTPHFEEIQLCDNLLSYIQRFASEPDVNMNVPEATSDEKCEHNPPEAGMTVLRKKDDDPVLFKGVVKQKTRRTRKDKRRSLSNKPINHTPEIFDQFAKLKLTAPATTNDVPLVITALENKKQKLSQESQQNKGDDKLNLNSFLPDCKAGMSETMKKFFTSMDDHESSTSMDSEYHFPHLSRDNPQKGRKPRFVTVDVECASVRAECSSVGTESAICDESIPSTPEVFPDSSVGNKHLPAASPTPSFDSGTVCPHPLDDTTISILKAEMTLEEGPTSPTPSENSTVVPDESISPVDSRSDSLEEQRDDSLVKSVSSDAFLGVLDNPQIDCVDGVNARSKSLSMGESSVLTAESVTVL